jgi:hypothetical protein
MRLTVRPLTPDLWPALEDLFGKNGACNGCWCMYFRIGSAYRLAVWSLSCLYVRIGYRRRGVTAALNESPSASGTGFSSTFARAGFKTVARRIPARPIMRHDLKGQNSCRRSPEI